MIVNAWLTRGIVIAGIFGLLAIPAFIHRKRNGWNVRVSNKDWLEKSLLALNSVGFLLQLLWLTSPWLRFADYPIHPFLVSAGIMCLILGLWLLYRSHADLGANWSITLELREQHELVTVGIYKRLRHPMYLALLVYATGQALVIPNWLAGPSYLLTFLLLVAVRISREERMMLEAFPDAYRLYMVNTKRLVPGVW